MKPNPVAIYCVGRNYAEHAKELNNPIPSEPVIFMKSVACLAPMEGLVRLPANLGRLDYETEIYILLKKDVWQGQESNLTECVAGYGIALDLTLREKQDKLKQKQQPWTMAKNFINACPITDARELADASELESLNFSLKVNGEIRQDGNTQDMLFGFLSLVNFISRTIPLRKGDMILTGTPAGVGPFIDGDKFQVQAGAGSVTGSGTIVMR